MKSSNREEIVDHDAKGLFDIVLDIESYPYFIPWCSAMRIHSKNKNEIYRGICYKNNRKLIKKLDM